MVLTGPGLTGTRRIFLGIFEHPLIKEAYYFTSMNGCAGGTAAGKKARISDNIRWVVVFPALYVVGRKGRKPVLPVPAL